MIRRDLQWLLGTRRTLQRPPPEGALTVTEYGLPDFAAVTPSDESALRRMEITIQDAIDAFEPRLQAVRVHVEASPTTPGQVHVSVEATLAVGEIREPVSFPFQVRTMD